MAYVLSGDYWGKQTVSYYIDLADANQMMAALRAFEKWDSELALDFVRVYTPAEGDITVSTVDIDGPQMALARAKTFTNPENQITKSVIQFDSADGVTFQTALHEIGHAIGLDHSGDPSTIMSWRVDLTLDGLQPDDIAGGQILYSAPELLFGWNIGWNFGWYHGWAYGWNADWYVGWGVGWHVTGDGWTYGWTYGWNVGWNVGWHIGWGNGWNFGWSVGWYYS